MKIIFVDDSPENLQLFKVYLKSLPDEIEYYQDSKKVFDVLKLKSFDLLFFDIRMPDPDGYELITKCKTLPGLAKSFFVALTAMEGVKEAEKIKAAGFNCSLSKPIIKKDLINFIDDRRKEI